VGRKVNDIFSRNPPEFLAYKKIWHDTVDGFMACTNSDLLFLCISGNIRIVVVIPHEDGTTSFSQYFMSELDGKVLTIQSDTQFAIQNMDSEKSSFILGYFKEDLQFKYSSKTIFDWKKKSP
jgi:hypothetical protein